MQIQEMLGRYNSNIQTAQSAQGTEQTSMQKGSPVSSLSVVSVFEGTVGKMDGDTIQLLLGNGKTVNARLGTEMALFPGQSMFFEVAGKDQNTVSIRPYRQGETMGNPTLVSALEAAGLKTDSDNLRMVDMMMKEQLPIDRNSLNEMARLIRSNPGIEDTTIIQMKKLDLPVTKEMAASFENYKTDSHQILKMMDEVLSKATEAFGEKGISGMEAVQLNDKLLNILSEGAAPAEKTAGEAVGQGADSAKAGEAGQASVNGEGQLNADGKVPGDGAENAVINKEQAEGNTAGDPAKGMAKEAGTAVSDNSILQETAGKASETDASKNGNVQNLNAAQEEAAQVTGKEERAVSENAKQTDPFMTREGFEALEKQIRELDKKGDFPMKAFSGAKTAKEAAGMINEFLKNEPELPEEGVKKLLSGKEYLKLLKEVTRDQWSIKPEQFSEDKVKTFYENLDRQMKQTESVLREMGMKDTDLGKSVNDLKSNLEFMNEINQTYTYMQMPIRFHNNNANGDLYVYTNKKNLADKDGELTAFLHFDMENLGSTDISVKMISRDVSTKFFMENEEAFKLVSEHAPELQRRLERKGYSCSIETVNDEKKVDFVEDFLKAEVPDTGVLHRYSFDMKA